MYLDGGINTEFNLVAYRVRIVNTIQKMIGDATDDNEKIGVGSGRHSEEKTAMKNSRFTNEQISFALKQAETVIPVEEV